MLYFFFCFSPAGNYLTKINEGSLIMSHTNTLTHAEAERLHMAVKELGNFQRSIGEILMNGYDATTPGELVNNRVRLVQNMAELHVAFSLLLGCRDIDGDQLNVLTEAKLKTMYDYMCEHAITATELTEAGMNINEKNWGENVFQFFRRGKKQHES